MPRRQQACIGKCGGRGDFLCFSHRLCTQLCNSEALCRALCDLVSAREHVADIRCQGNQCRMGALWKQKVRSQALYIATSDDSLHVPPPSSAVVLMVVQEGERNAIDQKKIEYALQERHQLRLIRRTLVEIHE